MENLCRAKTRFPNQWSVSAVVRSFLPPEGQVIVGIVDVNKQEVKRIWRLGLNENTKSLIDEDQDIEIPDVPVEQELLDFHQYTEVSIRLTFGTAAQRDVIKEHKLFVADKPEEKDRAWAAYTAYRELCLQFNKLVTDYFEATGVKFDAKQQD